MLLQLSIHHLALINDMTIDFEPGMNVMTGETGAGKSIVVDAVNLVLGERADRDLITNGEMKARVEAVFDIADNEKVKALLGELTLTGDEDTASISRELTSAGRNICRINGTIVPLQTLKQVSAQLLDIHGQHEHQLLLDSKNHIGYLDEYAADEVRPLLAENEQPIVTSHGELQLLNDQRLVGDVKMKGGLDVNGVKDSSLNGYLDLKDTKADTAMGLGVNSVSHFVVEPDDDGADVEHFTGSVALSYRDNGEDEYSLIAAVEGNTKTDGDAFATLADVSLTLTDIFKLGANVTLEQADYEEIEFAGGQAIDMTQLTDAQLDQIQNEVTQQAAKLSTSLVLHPGVLANLLTLVSD